MSDDDYRAAWIQGYLIPRYPELVSSYLDAREIAETALMRGFLPDFAAERLEQYCRDRRTVLSENVSVILGELAEHFQPAKVVIERLSTDAKVARRINALVSVDSAITFTSWHESMVLRALSDRSTRVRMLAGGKAVSRNLVSAIPLLQTALSSEGNENAKRELRFNLELLQTGYYIQHRNGSNWLTIKKGAGTKSGYVSDEDLLTKGLAACAAELSR